jgi:Putative zinc-finger
MLAATLGRAGALCIHEGALLMDHDVVVRQKMTEKYLLDELDPAARDEFEEHFFDCPNCAVDVHAGALFIEQSKIALAEKQEFAVSPATDRTAVKPGWPTRLRALWRPAFALPVMALLLLVVGYQNLVTYPRLTHALNSPRVLAFASINVGTYGDATPITTRPGEGFLLFVRIPEGGYSYYSAELYNPAGKSEWSLTIPAVAGQDRWPIQIPATNRPAGNYRLAVRGVTTAGVSTDIGQASFELQLQK